MTTPEPTPDDPYPAPIVIPYDPEHPDLPDPPPVPPWQH